MTRQVLVNAQTAKSAVSQLLTKYGEILAPAGGSPDASTAVPAGLAGYRGSAEGLAERKFLAEYARPIAVDSSFDRARDIEELTHATADLLNRALEPHGTWGSFDEEMKELRSRFDRALAALETGTKSYILIEVRTKTEESAMAYSKAMAAARAARGPLAAPAGGASPSGR